MKVISGRLSKALTSRFNKIYFYEAYEIYNAFADFRLYSLLYGV